MGPDLIRERTMAGLAAARARGRRGGRKFELTKNQIRLAQSAMAIGIPTWPRYARSSMSAAPPSIAMSVRMGPSGATPSK